ncbi:hypothetical protein CYLTODRAFT_379196 [Cylindrobasidium torrendii FP15055 ss-10]|uniref:Uncharacterized protein n=1 Tax=Cylindrobasidium torrendii FP15055 ss-10 TaxID=1314674 RepID=A0A0D7B515_9AGAR|nr:hypothetical protein CYLTODRAFT_379196 [Cylindrobasidium torrendii FP15055 ss-10]
MPPKRKATETPAERIAKKARTIVDAVLEDTEGYVVPDDADETRQIIIDLAQYARSLEESSKAKVKSPAQIEEAAEKLRNAARSGIKKQMTWKPSCKTGGSRWTYDGVCNDPEVFGAMLNLGGPPTWKAKKMTAAEFQEIMGDIEGHARFNQLYLRGNVNIQWKVDEGTFKFTGVHGI